MPPSTDGSGGAKGGVPLGVVGRLNEGVAGLLPKTPSCGVWESKPAGEGRKLKVWEDEEGGINGGSVGGDGVNIELLGGILGVETKGAVRGKAEDEILVEGNGGGVLGREDPSFENFTSSVFTDVGHKPNVGLGAAGWGFGVGAFSGLASWSTFSSSKDSGAVASGELRDGRVLGLPSPIPNGKVVDAATGDGVVLGDRTTGTGGDPGGVVLSLPMCSRSEGCSLSVAEEGPGGDEGLTLIAGASGFGVAERDLDESCGVDGKGTLAASSAADWSSSSPVSDWVKPTEASSVSEKPSSERNTCESSSGTGDSSNSSSSSPSPSSSAWSPETSTNEDPCEESDKEPNESFSDTGAETAESFLVS
jgi:hypothetical protein